MNIQKAESILNEYGMDEISSEELYSLSWYVNWDKGDKEVCLDGHFTPIQLIAIATYIQHQSLNTRPAEESKGR